MVTAAPPPLTALAKAWDGADPRLLAEYPSAVFSGIVPDIAHLQNGGYHVSIEDLIRWGNGGDYSNRRWADRSPPVSAEGTKFSVALDMSMSRADMAKHYKRVRSVFDDRSDPRRPYLNYVNTWDGVSDNATRFNFVDNRTSIATSDHKWHVHTDWARMTLDFTADPARAEMALRAYRSVILGETAEQWLESIGALEEDMARLTFFLADGKYMRSNGATIRQIKTSTDYKQIKDRGDCFPDTDENGFPTPDIILDAERGGWTWEQIYLAYGPDEATLGGGAPTPVGPVDLTPAAIGEIRDAVADLGEGGAAQVRADA